MHENPRTQQSGERSKDQHLPSISGADTLQDPRVPDTEVAFESDEGSMQLVPNNPGLIVGSENWIEPDGEKAVDVLAVDRRKTAQALASGRELPLINDQSFLVPGYHDDPLTLPHEWKGQPKPVASSDKKNSTNSDKNLDQAA